MPKSKYTKRRTFGHGFNSTCRPPRCCCNFKKSAPVSAAYDHDSAIYDWSEITGKPQGAMIF
jgi:hypothetical protein